MKSLRLTSLPVWILLTLALSHCGPLTATSKDPGFALPTTEEVGNSGRKAARNGGRIDPNQKELLGKFHATFYYVVDEATYPDSPEKAEIKDVQGNLISIVTKKFKKDLNIEGTGFLKDGRTVNYAAKVGKEIRYRVSSAKWGWGVGGCPLKPYRSIAVDPFYIPLGTVVFIPQAVGAVLPGGEIHDGIFYAEDIGGWIKKMDIDFFSASGIRSSKPFEDNGLRSGMKVEAFVQRAADSSGCHVQPEMDSNEFSIGLRDH